MSQFCYGHLQSGIPCQPCPELRRPEPRNLNNPKVRKTETNREAIGAIVEIAGAAGVTLTLLYLAVQIRQNTRASRLNAIQESTENSARFSEFLASDADLGNIFWQGLVDPESLNLDEKRRFIATLNIFMRREAMAFFLHQEGLLPDEFWSARVTVLSGTLNQPGMELYLKSASDNLPRKFLDHVLELTSRESTLSEEAREILKFA